MFGRREDAPLDRHEGAIREPPEAARIEGRLMQLKGRETCGRDDSGQRDRSAELTPAREKQQDRNDGRAPSDRGREIDAQIPQRVARDDRDRDGVDRCDAVDPSDGRAKPFRKDLG